MKLNRPVTLAGQTLAVLLLAIAASHLIGIAIYSQDHRRTVTYTEAHDLADRVIGMVNLLQRIPGQWREDVVRQSDGRTFHVMLGSEPDENGADLDETLSREVARYLRNQFPDWPADRIRVSLTDTPLFEREKILSNQAILDPETALNVRRARQTYDFLHVSVRLEETTWLNLIGALPKSKLSEMGWAIAYIVSLAAGVAAFAGWLIFRVSAPLGEFARAADRMGRDVRSEPLAVTGPAEVAEAAAALNLMQERLRRLMENRSQMLGAISHDLRTPVTLLRLRAEAIGNRKERETFLRTLDEMEAMISSVLEFTRATVLDEPQRLVDLSALLGTICDDMKDAGAAVEFEPPDAIPYACRRVSLKRAFNNLIDNAVKYGGGARVRLEPGDETIVITIEDDGPGIPEEQQAHVFMPFHRLDASRRADAGGVGLGLSIAQTIIDGHGGRIELKNRSRGGLRLRVLLPA